VPPRAVRAFGSVAALIEHLPARTLRFFLCIANGRPATPPLESPFGLHLAMSGSLPLENVRGATSVCARRDFPSGPPSPPK